MQCASVTRFLYADPTPSALQVFVRSPGLVQAQEPCDLPAEEGDEEGIWLTVDPIPGCVVCNIGESKSRGNHDDYTLIVAFVQCGRSGRTAYIRVRCTASYTEDQIIGTPCLVYHSLLLTF